MTNWPTDFIGSLTLLGVGGNILMLLFEMLHDYLLWDFLDFSRRKSSIFSA